MMKDIKLYAFCLFCLLVLNLPFSFGQKVEHQISEKLKEVMCGPESLSLICQMLGVQVTPEKIAHMINLTEKGASMKDLADAAYKLGLKAVGRKIDNTDLMRMKHPVITHIKPDHFIVVKPISSSKLLLFESLSDKGPIITAEQFRNIWDGYVLVVSPGKVVQGDIPKIKIERPFYDFGQASQEQVIEHDFTIKNLGKSTLKIEKVSQSCTCTASLLSDSTIPPGGSTNLHAEFNTKHARGRQTVYIRVHSNDPYSPTTFAIITGVVAGIIRVSPNFLYLSDIHFSEKVHRAIEVYDPGHGKLEVKRAYSSSPLIKTKVNSVHKGELVAMVDVTVNPGSPLGKIKEKIIIETNDMRYPETEVLVKGMVIGDIKLYPKQIFFGFVECGNESKQSVRLIKHGKKNLQIEKVKNESKFIHVKVITVKKGKIYDIEATCKTESPGPLKETIQVYTNSSIQPKFEIPVYAIIK